MFLATAQAPSHGYSITGTVLSATGGDPIRNVHLLAETFDGRSCPNERLHSVEADADTQGHFALEPPCAGTWRLTASGPGFRTQSYKQHDRFTTGIVLTPTEPTFDLQFSITPNGYIRGYILDEAGEPVRDAKPSLLDTSTEEPRPVATTTTDDRGFYEFPNLLPGSYEVAVQVQPWWAVASMSGRAGSSASGQNASPDPSLDLTYPLTFYPGVADPRSATPLNVTAGAILQADIRLSPVPSIHVLIAPPGGRPLLPFSSGNQGRRGGPAPEIIQVSPLGETPFQPSFLSTHEDGSIEVGGFAPGTYSILGRDNERNSDRGRGFHPEQHLFTLQKDAPRAISIQPNALPIESGSDAATANLSGTVDFQAKPAAGTMLLLVAAAPPDAVGRLKIHRQQSNTDGSFTFERVPLGKYILIAIADGWATHWADIATLSNYLLKGTPVQLTHTATLPRPIEAQAKN